jgi:Transposase DDE domain
VSSAIRSAVYGRCAIARPAVGSHRTTAARSAARRGLTVDGRASRMVPVSPHPLRTAERHSVADVATGTGLRIADDMLATPARLATRRYLGPAALALLNRLACDGGIDWSRAIVDSCSVRAVCGGTETGPNPTDRAKRGSKRHLICDGQGVPLAVRLTGANRNDSQEALALVDAIPPLQGRRGRPRWAQGVLSSARSTRWKSSLVRTSNGSLRENTKRSTEY